MVSLQTQKITKVTLFLILGAVGIFFQSGSLITIAVALLLLVLFEKYIKIKIPTSISIVYIIFIIASVILGSGYHFYDRFAHWDDMLHFSYGLGFAFVGFAIIQYFSIRRKVNNDTILVVLFSFCFTVAMGVIWEIYEFSVDSFLGWNMQSWDIGRGVNDTMWDLILAVIAASVTNIYIYFYLEFGSDNWIARISKEFKDANKLK